MVSVDKWAAFAFQPSRSLPVLTATFLTLAGRDSKAVAELVATGHHSPPIINGSMGLTNARLEIGMEAIRLGRVRR